MPDPDPTTEFAFPLDSEMWRINHQKCGLLFGPAAAILQIAHPRIARGVADHSQFETDTLGRLRRTLASTNRIAFGTRAEAVAMRKRMETMHRGVRGRISPGMEGSSGYSAFEPDLLLWVLATLIMAALQGYELVYGKLPRSRREQFYREMRAFGEYFGLSADYGPADIDEFDTYYAEMLGGQLLGSHELCERLAQSIAAPTDTRSAERLGNVLRFLTIESLPSGVRERLGFRSTVYTRTAMKTLRTMAPFCFRWLPRQWRLFPESLERLEREEGTVKTQTETNPGFSKPCCSRPTNRGERWLT